jgi:ABC-type uncharacterized transport system substrate-binding protein
MRRREFMALLGSAAAAWPLGAEAEQSERMRRIGVLMNLPAGDPEAAPHVAAFQEALRDLGWNVGRNIQMDVRWASGNLRDNRKYAAELIAQAPEVILASTTVALGPLLELTHTIPIVFVNATDPRELIVTLAARYKLPAVYFYRFFVTGGGLICYGPDSMDGYRRAAGYVDRILKGEKAADLPVQGPVKYQLVINLKPARALGLEVPPSLLARADEVIE